MFLPLSLLIPLIIKISVTAVILLVLVAFIIFYFVFTRKEKIFGGRSLGKGIFGLMIVNDLDGSLPEFKILKKREQIEFFILPLDLLAILFTGKEISDSICKTDVRIYENKKKDMDI